MQASDLHIVTAVYNPLRWQSRTRLARDAIRQWVADGASVTVVECSQGEQPCSLHDIPGIHHIHVVAHSIAWNKECLINIGISRLPHHAKYIGVFDADIHFRKRHWIDNALHMLQIHPVIQPWVDAYDLGPNDEHFQSHKSFCSQYFKGQPVTANSAHFWKFNNGPYDYPHSGFAWIYTRRALNELGGLMEFCGMGSGDHHMALSLVGLAKQSMPGGISTHYENMVYRWQSRALHHINRNIGFAPGTIEHAFHGRKVDRKYVPRWKMFLQHGFNPDTDLKKNSYGVIEFAGNKPELQREFHRYLIDRQEDCNTL